MFQERKEGRQTGLENGQRVGRGEGQGQRRPVGAEVKGHRAVPEGLHRVLSEGGTRKRASHQSAVPRGERRDPYSRPLGETAGS